jgi:hypothetical protein
MHPLIKAALGALLAVVIVRYAGRGTVLRALIEGRRKKDVPVVHPSATGAPF